MVRRRVERERMNLKTKTPLAIRAMTRTAIIRAAVGRGTTLSTGSRSMKLKTTRTWTSAAMRTRTPPAMMHSKNSVMVSFGLGRQHDFQRLLIPNRIRKTVHEYMQKRLRSPAKSKSTINDSRLAVRYGYFPGDAQQVNSSPLSYSFSPHQSALRQHPKNPSLLLFFFFNCSSVGGAGSAFCCTFSGNAC
jgi:hypothetical protein